MVEDLEGRVKKLLNGMSREEQIRVISELLRDLKGESPKKDERDDFFYEELTDPMEW